jgi:DNA-binding phage protein
MEIKKTAAGWEYDGIVFVDERSAIAAKEANEKAHTVPANDPNAEIRLVYDSDKGTTFGNFVIKFLKQTNGSIVRLAKDIGVSRQALFDWMNAKSIPSRKHVQAILIATGCTQDELKNALHDNFEMQKIKLFEDLKEA